MQGSSKSSQSQLGLDPLPLAAPSRKRQKCSRSVVSPEAQQSQDPRRRDTATQRLQISRTPRAPPALPPPPPPLEAEDAPPPPPMPQWLKDQAQQGPLSRRDLFLVGGTAAGLVGFKVFQGNSDGSDEPEIGNRAGLPAVEMPSGRSQPNGSLRPNSSTAKRKAPKLTWTEENHLYVTSKQGAKFNVMSAREPGYVILHSLQTDKWYSLKTRLEEKVNVGNKPLMYSLFWEDWESTMREFRAT